MDILITNPYLVHLTGSEVNSVEFSEYFQSRGHNVDVVVNKYGGAGAALLKDSAPSVVVYSLTTIPNKKYDLIWNMAAVGLLDLNEVLKRVSGDNIVNYTLSPFQREGTPPPVEMHKYYANSWETQQAWERNVIMDILPNMAPDRFFVERTSLKLTRVAIVSNHVPKELYEARTILMNAGIDVVHHGFGGKVARITPDLLISYSAVITIGKTVQYGLAAQTPIYCYDKFGGPGYITPQNIDLAGKYNFSGRCCRRQISGVQIASEIIEGYTDVSNMRVRLQEIAKEQYHLGSRMDNVMRSIF